MPPFATGQSAAPDLEIRIGLLGASRVAVYAMIQPARNVSGVSVTAVGGRDVQRTRKYAERWKIPQSLDDYEAVVCHPEIDVIYNGLPNGLHAYWSIRALEAGKHVLCEKPLAANQADAERMRDAAEMNGRILMEGFHYRHHPLAQRIKQLVTAPDAGRLQHVDAKFCIFWPNRRDIRFSAELAGGALMDIGCYVVNLARYLMNEEPEVVDVKVRLIKPDVDSWATVQLVSPSGVTARLVYSLRSPPWNWRAVVRARSQQRRLTIINPFMPHKFCWLRVQDEQGKRSEKIEGARKPTYEYQLEALAAAVRGQAIPETNAADAVQNMRVIDAIYRQAGLQRRS